LAGSFGVECLRTDTGGDDLHGCLGGDMSDTNLDYFTKGWNAALSQMIDILGEMDVGLETKQMMAAELVGLMSKDGEVEQ
jgi:hypothetical protein